jgi:hypothetical protein
MIFYEANRDEFLLDPDKLLDNMPADEMVSSDLAEEEYNPEKDPDVKEGPTADPMKPHSIEESLSALIKLEKLLTLHEGKVESVKKYLQENPGKPSYKAYIQWSKSHGGDFVSSTYFSKVANRIEAKEDFNRQAHVEPEAEKEPFELGDEFGELGDILGEMSDDMLSPDMSVKEKYDALFNRVYNWASNPKTPLEDQEEKKEGALKRHAIICGNPGIGKEQPHSSKIKIPGGWTTMGDIQVGDQVTTPDSSVATVVQKFPQGVKPVYEIELKDGRKVEAGLEHLWKVKVRHHKNYDKHSYEVIETQDLIELMEQGADIYLPFTQPIKGDEVDLPMDPYSLGLLLGDGGLTSAGISFTSIDEELVDSLEKRLKTLDENIQIVRAEKDHRVITKNHTPGKPTSINNVLRLLGLKGASSHTKFIPEMYKETSISNRLEIIRGLMDTDGYVTKQGATQYTTVSTRLAQDFADIIYSLGGRCNVQNKSNDFGGFYTLTFSLPISLGAPVRLTRKLERYQNNNRQLRENQKIVSIQYSRMEKSSCILIDSDDHLYLTDGYVVTHNTYTVMEALKAALEVNDTFHTHYVRGSVGGSESSVFAFLYKFRKDYLIIFDDCDSFLDSKLGNIMKGVLELDNPFTNTGSIDIRKRGGKALGELTPQPVFESSEGTFISKDMFGQLVENGGLPAFGLGDDEEDEEDEDGGEEEKKDPILPQSFSFKSRVLFISNKKKGQLDSAVRSRCKVRELSLTADEIIERIEMLLPVFISKGSGVDPKRMTWAKNNAFKWLKLAVVAKGAPIALPGGRSIRFPDITNYYLEFRHFIDLTGSWLEAAKDYQRKHGVDLMGVEKLPLAFVRTCKSENS